MFKGNIRKCLKCGEVGELEIKAHAFISCPTKTCTHFYFRVPQLAHEAVSVWNRQNIPPDKLTGILHFYAQFKMRLP